MASPRELAAILRVKDEASDDINRFRDNLERIEQRMGVDLPAAARTMAIGIAGVVSAASAAGGALFELGAKFDEAFDRITIKTGATGAQLEQLQEDFRAVVQDVPTDFAKASEAIGALAARTGQTGEALQQLAKQELELARLTGNDLGEQLRVTTRLFGDWGIATDEQSVTLDKLLRISQETGVNINELAQNVVQFGAPMRELGISFDEAVALMAKWEREGVNVETVASTMRIAVARLSEAGIDPAQGFRDLLVTIRDLPDPLQATQLAMAAFGQRGGADMAAAIREGRFSIDDLLDTLDDAEGTITETADKTDDAKETMVKAWNAVAVAAEPIAGIMFELAGTIAEHVEPIMKTFAADLTNIANALKLISSGAVTWQELLTMAMGINTPHTAPQQPDLSGIHLTRPEQLAGMTNEIDTAGEQAVAHAERAGRETGGRFNQGLVDALLNKDAKGGDVREHVERAVQEIAQLTQDTFQEAFAAQAIGAGLGPGRSIFEAITRAAIEGGQGNIDALARQAADFREKVMQEFDPDEADAIISEFFDRVAKAIADPTAEARAAVGEFVQSIDVAAQIKKLGQERADAINEATDRAAEAIHRAQDQADEQAAQAQAQFDKERAIADQRKRLQDDLKAAQDAVRSRQQESAFQTQTDRSVEDRNTRRDREDLDRAQTQAKELTDVAAKGQAAINAAHARGDTIATVQAMLAVQEQKKAIQDRIDAENAAVTLRRQREDEDFALQQQRRRDDLEQQKANARELLNDPAVVQAQTALEAFNTKILEDNLAEKIQGYFDARDKAIAAANQALTDTEQRADQRFQQGAERLGAAGGVVNNNVTVNNYNSGIQGPDAINQLVEDVLQQAADRLNLTG